jgi:hypothetical protein
MERVVWRKIIILFFKWIIADVILKSKDPGFFNPGL